ncbi:hypothetical protein KF913_22395 [Candidatus Obscuribacterales bacterium]|nr:hypothetical protein [Candidatus Obscuribacterales bacterium]
MHTPGKSDKSDSGKHMEASTVLAEHMSTFAYEPEVKMQAEQALKFSTMGGAERNKTVLDNMQRESQAVRELYKVRSLPLAEGFQEKVVKLSDDLDLRALSADSKRLSEQAARTKDPAQRQELLSASTSLAVAGASPFIERARLGAIQLRQGKEGAAERTFAEAIKTNIPDVSAAVPSVQQLKQAVIERHEELKVKRTLPEVFKANVDWIDTGKDGAVDRNELRTASADKSKNITAKTLIQYLMKNFDNIDHGTNGIAAADVSKYWRQQNDPNKITD